MTKHTTPKRTSWRMIQHKTRNDVVGVAQRYVTRRNTDISSIHDAFSNIFNNSSKHRYISRPSTEELAELLQ